MLNVLMGNGDAHIKNWSLIYDNPLRPRLSPAYDLVSTVAYTTHDRSAALNMGKVKDFEVISLTTFDAFLDRIGVLDQVREDIMEVARDTGRKILDVWGGQFAKAGVPIHLIHKVEEHQKKLALKNEFES
jgi:serine/threonine-protein kinase HipA